MKKNHIRGSNIWVSGCYLFVTKMEHTLTPQIQKHQSQFARTPITIYVIMFVVTS
jgi:hypothetical protein